MDGYVETVRVVSEVSIGNPAGYVTINKSDLTDKHELFVGEVKELPTFTLPPAVHVTADVSIAVDPSLTGNEAVGLSDNDPEVTAAGAAKKPWEQAQ